MNVELAPYARRLRQEKMAGRLATALSLFSPRFRLRYRHRPRRIGVMAQWGIGDAVLLLPLLRGLKQAYPEAAVELIGKPWLEQLFSGEQCGDRAHLLVPPWTAYSNKYSLAPHIWKNYLVQLREVRKVPFDWLISTRFDPREIIQLRLLRARETIGFRSAGGRYWITRDIGFNRSAFDRLHRSEVSAAVLRVLAPDSMVAPVKFRPNSHRQAQARAWLCSRGYRSGIVLAVHSDAGHPIRRWREQHFETVIQSLRVQPSMIVFIGCDTASVPISVPHTFWHGDLAELKALLSVCDVFLGTDSGVMHMAAAAGCKVVAAFGPGEPRWFSPVGKDHAVVFSEPMPCRPCFDACIYRAPLCLTGVTDRTLANAVEEQILRSDKNRAGVRTGCILATGEARVTNA